MANNFKDDKIQKVKNGTLRLQTIIVHEGMFVTSKVGAGILLKEGYVLTCAHVVSHKVDFKVPDEGMAVSHKVYFEVPELGMALAPHWLAGKVLANFYGGVQCNAEVLSVDVGNDLALLKIPESAIQPYNIPCEFSEGVRDGAEFFVVGHPNGPPFNVKFGFVSNRSRPPSDIPRDILDGFPHSFDHMDKAMEFLELQVEAAPGFSGGPLSTVDGLVFGVLHAGIEKTIYGIPYAIIKSAVRRMFNRSRSPGYNVFYHLNKLIKTSEDHKATADKLKAEVAKVRKEASTANTASHALKQKLDEMKAEQQKLVDVADKKGFQEVASLQDEACGVGYILGLKAAGIPKTSNLYKAMPKYPRQTPTVVLEPETSTPAKDTEKIDSPTEAAADGEPKI